MESPAPPAQAEARQAPEPEAAGIPEAWPAEVQKRMAAGERAIRPDGADAFRVVNRRQGFSARFGKDGGVSVAPRDGSAGEVRIALAGVGRGGVVMEASAESAALGECGEDGAVDEKGECLKRLSVERAGGVVEWWESREEGIEQGFVIEKRPAGQGRLGIEVAVQGAAVEVSGERATSATLRVNAKTAWAYGGLRVVDARGEVLESFLERGEAGGIRIVVEDGEAVYPVVVDPVLGAAADWVVEGEQVGAEFGTSVASAGDVNGDGFGDVIVGAPKYDNGQLDEGRAYVYLGSASGLGTVAAWTAEADQVNAWFGYSVASAGDINGDGFGDVIVGAPGYSNGQSGEGRVHVYLGSTSGLGAGADWTVESDQASASFGTSVASAGDINGDGFGDVIVGAPGYSNGQSSEGRAYEYLGSVSGLQANAAWTAESDQVGANFGGSVASAGDVNGDGFGDVIIGARNYDNGQTDEGRAYVYPGSASGLLANAAWTAESDQAGANFGGSVASAGDVNSDGFGDVIVAAYAYDNGQPDEGRVYAYLGSAVGLPANAVWTAESNQAVANLGSSVASAGDVNGDGYGDVIVGADHYDSGQTDEGGAFVYLGSANGLQATAAWKAEPDLAGTYFGYSVASAGDVDGDGFGDVVVGARRYVNGQTDQGHSYMYLGGLTDLPTTAVWTAESNQSYARFGVSVASAGDVNADGYGDVIVGASEYDNGQTDEGRAYVYLGSATGLGTNAAWMVEANQASAYLGSSVASAGDVNGDGYGDVIVGASGYDNGQTDEGRAYVYLGSAMGLGTAAWMAESDQADAAFGSSVASAGDVNGDGYGDVIVGAYGYDNDQTNQGRTFVYLGSASGLKTTAAWMAESDQAFAAFGYSVASAGDVNGDGYGDVIVGAPWYDDGESDEGRSYVYLGDAAGLQATPAWKAESNQANASFGFPTHSAGDVNGDGFADVIICAQRSGTAYVYQGSATGLPSSPAWTTTFSSASKCSVAGAGDVNGDGYGDVVIGGTSYGGGSPYGYAYLFLGGASGLSPSAAWTGQSNQTDAAFGGAVAGAGDVNGDGYGDIIVGAFNYDNPEVNEGRAHVYSLAAAGRVRLRLSDPAANHPVAPWGAVAGSSLRTAVLGGTPFGRLSVKTEVEVKPLGLAFDGLATTISPNWTSGFSGGVFQDLVTDVPLVHAQPHHLRFRLRYRPSEGRPAVASRWIYAPPSGDARGVHFRLGVCGNGVLQGDEGCDDGNTTLGDGCNASCKWEQGSSCTLNTASACATGFCADGVCCNSACTGPCRACTAQLKGNGLDGECGNIAEGTDPESDCVVNPESTCQQDGFCDGNGACRLWVHETPCAPNTCSGNASKRSVCNGFGTCLFDLIGTDCGPNGCNPATGQCFADCTTDADCTADAYCDPPTGQCIPKAPLGTSCTASEQCQSGNCIDGVCCNEPCDGTCQACGQDGLCGNAPAGTSDDACAPDPLTPCGNTGQCTDAGTCALAAKGASCAEPSCANGMAQTSSCDGEGTCVATTTACGDYACDATACKTSCAQQADCATGFACNNGTCKPDTTLGNTCKTTVECSSGHCIDLSPDGDAGMGKVCCASDCTAECNTGHCTTEGTCELAPAGKPCGDAGLVCNDQGACAENPSAVVDCSPYQHAEPSLCKTSCANNADCLDGYECRNKQCGTKICDDAKKCLERESCDASTHTCIPAVNESGSCACQMPGQDSPHPRWPALGVALALLMRRRARSAHPSSRRA